jgi:hypothetical protein
MDHLAGLDFVEAVSFNGDGLSDTVLFKGKEALGMGSLTFRITAFPGDNIAIDTIVIKSDEQHIGLIALGENEEDAIFLTKTDLNGDGVVDKQDHERVKKIFESVILPEIEALQSYFGVSAKEI